MERGLNTVHSHRFVIIPHPLLENPPDLVIVWKERKSDPKAVVNC